MEKQIDVKALFQFSYGLYLVGSRSAEGRLNGQIANAAMQITGDPCCVAVCLHQSNLTTEYIGQSGVFSVSVLEQEAPMTFIGQFGFKCGRDIDKFCNVPYLTGQTGAPMATEHALAVLEAKVVHRMDVFTHRLFVGEVVSSQVVREGTPLTYADYHLIKKGKSPKNAPTFGFNQLK